ncbi:hypothetical protein BH10PSE6_BH10PSE6_19500 [soil metagenome]
MSPEQEEEHALVDAAACAERRRYAVSMAAVVKSLTSAEAATAGEIAEATSAEAAARTAIKALEDYRSRH